MATQSFRAGPSKCYVSKPSGNALPSFATLSFTASGVTVDDSVYNSIQDPLDTTLTYQVVLAPLGSQGLKGGFSVGRASPSSGNLTLTSGQAIEVSVPLGSWTGDYDEGYVGIFLKAGNADFRLSGVLKPSTVATSRALVLTLPDSEEFTLSTLQSTTNPLNQKALGNRTPGGYIFEEITPTTGSVTVTFLQGNVVQFSPNTSADFSVVGARPIGVTFQGMVNSEKEITKSTAGDWAEWTNTGVTYQQGQFGINTAAIVAKGNAPMELVFPPDPDTGAETRVLLFGLLLQNQEEIALAWSKSEQTALTYNYQPAPLDVLFNNQSTVYTYASFVEA